MDRHDEQLLRSSSKSTYERRTEEFAIVTCTKCALNDVDREVVKQIEIEPVAFPTL